MLTERGNLRTFSLYTIMCLPDTVLIWVTKQLKIKLMPEHVQSPPAPFHVRHQSFIQLTLLQYFNIKTTLSHPKCSSPIFALRKSSGKLRVLVNLRRVNHLPRRE